MRQMTFAQYEACCKALEAHVGRPMSKREKSKVIFKHLNEDGKFKFIDARGCEGIYGTTEPEGSYYWRRALDNFRSVARPLKPKVTNYDKVFYM